MNAIVSLCHFCEAHGPGSVFTTQTLRDASIDEHLFGGEEDATRKGCAACLSIGPSLGMLSHDGDSNANFVSSQVPVIADTVRLVKAAATRSLSCEVSSVPKEGAGSSSTTTASGGGGGFVFFGDAQHGHVFSHTFQIRDAQARGFYRLFSIVILMKDKSFLLNIQPFLSDALQTISRRLQDYAFATYTAEQSAGPSERAKRLTAGQANTQAPRSLAVLTGEQHIYAQLHTHFTWLLWAGARCLRETVALGCPTVPPWIDRRETVEGFAVVRMDKEEWLQRQAGGSAGGVGRTVTLGGVAYGEAEEDDGFTMRDAKELLRLEFAAACYCTVTGMQVVLRGPQTKTAGLMRCLSRLLPARMHARHVRTNSTRYVPASECRLLSVLPEVAVPQPQAHIFRVDFVRDVANDEVCIVKWTGQLPDKRKYFVGGFDSWSALHCSVGILRSARSVAENRQSRQRAPVQRIRAQQASQAAGRRVEKVYWQSQSHV